MGRPAAARCAIGHKPDRRESRRLQHRRRRGDRLQPPGRFGATKVCRRSDYGVRQADLMGDRLAEAREYYLVGRLGRAG
jgi:hypothetical protein